MKKTASLIVCGLLFIPMLVACGCNKQPEEPIKTTYTVTFDAVDGYFNGVENNKEIKIEVSEGETVRRQLNPIKDGKYAFSTWWADTGFTKEYDFTAPVKNDIHLYASYNFIGEEPFYFEIKAHPLKTDESFLAFDYYDEDKCNLDFDSIWYCVCKKDRYSDFQYESNWKHYEGRGTRIANLDINDRVYLRANEISWNGVKIDSYCGKWSVEGYSQYDVGGNIMSLLNKDNYEEMKDFNGVPNVFDRFLAGHINQADLLSNGHSLRDASKLRLPATMLSNECYCNMFFRSNVTKLPESIGDGKTVSFAERSCYQMFCDCDKFSTIPNDFIYPADIESYAFYGMFSNCQNLKNIGNLVIGEEEMEIGEYACCNMFSTCERLNIKLNVSEVLPSIYLKAGCYSNMFYQVPIIEIDGALPAMELADSCYASMFCRNPVIKEVDVTTLLPATTLAPHCYEGMFSGNPITNNLVSVKGVLAAETLASCCYRQMFSGCKALVEVPFDLLSSATTLAPRCYEGMFSYAELLEEAPYLPCEFLPSEEIGVNPEWKDWTGCYNSIFQSCTNLKKVTVGFSNFPYIDDATQPDNYIYTVNWLGWLSEGGEFYWNGETIAAEVRGMNTVPNNWTIKAIPPEPEMINLYK